MPKTSGAKEGKTGGKHRGPQATDDAGDKGVKGDNRGSAKAPDATADVTESPKKQPRSNNVVAPPFRSPGGVPARNFTAMIPMPSGTRVSVSRRPGALGIQLPSPGFCSHTTGLLTGFLLVFGILWVVSVVLFAMLLTNGGFPAAYAFFGIPLSLAGLLIIGAVIRTAFLCESIEIDRDNIAITRSCCGWKSKTSFRRKDATLVDIRSQNAARQRGKKMTADAEFSPLGYVPGDTTWCVVVEGDKAHRFGYSLSLDEQQWVSWEVAHQLQVPLGPGVAPASFEV